MYDWMKKGVTIVPNVLLHKYAELKISSDEFLMVVYLLSKLNQGEELEDLETVQEQLGWDGYKLSNVISSLCTKEYIDIELIPGKDGKKRDHYSLRSLFNKINRLYFASEAKTPTTRDISQDLVAVFEEEFGRPLSQMELSKLSTWMNDDKFNVDVIKVALREAVIRNAISFNYIDRILLNWKKKNIQTAVQAEKEIQIFQQKTEQSHKTSTASTKAVQWELPIIDPVNDWSKGGNQ